MCLIYDRHWRHPQRFKWPLKIQLPLTELKRLTVAPKLTVIRTGWSREATLGRGLSPALYFVPWVRSSILRILLHVIDKFWGHDIHKTHTAASVTILRMSILVGNPINVNWSWCSQVDNGTISLCLILLVLRLIICKRQAPQESVGSNKLGFSTQGFKSKIL